MITLVLNPEDGDAVTVESTELEGTLESSTATATATIPSGFTRVVVTASWD